MDRKNMALIGVAAVVIAICLVASYTYLAGGGSDDESGTREMGLGDYYLAAVTITDEEGTMQYLQEVTVVGIDGDTYTVRSETNWAGVSDIELVGTYDTFFSMPEGTEEGVKGMELDIPILGERVCDQYAYTDGQLTTQYFIDCETGMVIYVLQMEGDLEFMKETIILDTSAADDAPEYGSSDVVEFDTMNEYYGRFAVFYWDTDIVENVPRGYVITGFHDDGTITYYDADTDSQVTGTVESFLSMGVTADDTGSGRYLVSTVYGDRVCERYAFQVDEGTRYVYVGVDDGVCYRVSIVDEDGVEIANGELSYSSLVVGDIGFGEPRDAEVGDYAIYVERYSDPEEEQDFHILTYRLATASGDYTYTDFTIDGQEFDDPVEGLFNTGSAGEYWGTSSLNTVFGVLECDVYMSSVDGVLIFDHVYNGVIVQKVLRNTDEGSIHVYYLIETSLLSPVVPTGGTLNLGQAEIGSWFEYMARENLGEEWFVHEEVTDVLEDGTLMISTDGGEPTAVSDKFSIPEDAEYGGRMLVKTPVWGEVVCDYYFVETEYFTFHYYYGAYDGVMYVFATQFDDSFTTYELVGSSTVF